MMSSSSLSNDQRKYLAQRLLRNVHLKLVAASVCTSDSFQKGTGLTGTFVRYKRMFVPLATLTEGSDPDPNDWTTETVTVVMEQWGDIIKITDVAQLTTAHPALQLAMDLLSDNAQRVIDREIQIVWLAGTNIIYGDASVTSRATITSTMKIDDNLVTKAYVTMADAGAQPRGMKASGQASNFSKGSDGNTMGDMHYVGVTSPQVTADIRRTGTALGTWAAVQTYSKSGIGLYNMEVGTWLGIRWVESNFVPKFRLLGNTTAAVSDTASFGTDTPTMTEGSGGTLATSSAVYFKVTRKDKLRGFEEYISIEHSFTTSGATKKLTFDFTGLTAGYVYNLYAGTVTGDSNLKQFATQNIAVAGTAVLSAIPSSTTTAPANPRGLGDGSDPTAVHVVYIHADDSCVFSELQDLEMDMTPNQSLPGNVLKLARWAGYKFMAKAMRTNENFLLRLEVSTTH